MPLFKEPETSLQMIADSTHRPELAGVVDEVFPGGPADLAGIRPGDMISAVNGHPVEDVIDVQFHAAEPNCVLTIIRDNETLQIPVPKDVDQQLGLQFQEDLFDGIRLCANRCDFCFVDQQPTGMRDTLQLRDDDYRLSFLHGNFVTLTNLTDHDWQRIFTQKLSPLYVTVHATDNHVRRRLLRNRKSNDVLQEIERLTSEGISVHTQVVLCQGINDEEILDQTIRDLAAFYPAVPTLAVVPMGVTDYRLERNESEPYDRSGALKVLKQIRAWQREFETRLGSRFVYPSDEFYILAGKPLPRAHTYQGFPQLSNGVGGSRIFLDEIRACYRSIPHQDRRGRIQLVTGVLAEPLIERFAQAVQDILGYDTQVVAAVNNWYGVSTTVTGLLTGRDVKDALNKAGRADLAVIPDIMLRENTETFLDDLTVSDVSSVVGRPVIKVNPLPLAAMKTIAGL